MNTPIDVLFKKPAQTDAARQAEAELLSRWRAYQVANFGKIGVPSPSLDAIYAPARPKDKKDPA
jgi:hypothetical protein